MTIQWGVLGASSFARDNMAPAIHAAKGANFAALATSSADKAAGFQAYAPDIAVYTDYDAMLADPKIDAIYIPLPNHLHVPWTIKALEAGKHVLCEKPIALKASDFDDLIAARDRSGLVAAEAFMIPHHAQYARAKELVASGAIGDLVHIDGTFSYNNAEDLGNIRNDPAKGGAPYLTLVCIRLGRHVWYPARNRSRSHCRIYDTSTGWTCLRRSQLILKPVVSRPWCRCG